MSRVKCEMCGNTMGFVFGTCVECGWNDLDKTFHHIKVDVKDLPESVKNELILKHAKRYMKDFDFLECLYVRADGTCCTEQTGNRKCKGSIVEIKKCELWGKEGESTEDDGSS